MKSPKCLVITIFESLIDLLGYDISNISLIFGTGVRMHFPNDGEVKLLSFSF